MMTRWRIAAALALAAGMASAANPQADALYQSAVAKYSAADYQGAIRDAEAAVQLDPANWQAWQVDGNARYALGDKEGAVTVYRYALQGNPNNPQLKSFVDSLAGAQPAAAAAVPSSRGAYEAALTKYNAGDYDGAMQGAAAVVRADPNDWQAWQLLGNCRYARSDKRGALEAYDRSLSLHPDNPGIRTFADSLRAELTARPFDPADAGAVVRTQAPAEDSYKKWSIDGQLGPPLWMGVMAGYRPAAQIMVMGGVGYLSSSAVPPSSILLVALGARYDLSRRRFKPYAVGGYNMLQFAQEAYEERTGAYWYTYTIRYPAVTLTAHSLYLGGGFEYEFGFGLSVAAEVIYWMPLVVTLSIEDATVTAPVTVDAGFVFPNLQVGFHF